jgi:hypothetical protein
MRKREYLEDTGTDGKIKVRDHTKIEFRVYV